MSGPSADPRGRPNDEGSPRRSEYEGSRDRPGRRRSADRQPGRGRRRARNALGLIALGTVPVLLAGVPIVPLSWALGVGFVPSLLISVAVGVGTSAALGQIRIDRRIDRLPDADLDDRPAAFIEDRVSTLASAVGVAVPEVAVVRIDAANVAVVDGHRGPRLVVSTRLLSLPAADRDAALRHALVTLRTRRATIITALMPALLAVETLLLVARALIGHRDERTASDRRANRIHGYEPERNRVPGPLYTIAGVLLWIALLPVSIPFAIGDRLYVTGGRRAADSAVGRVGVEERDGLANAVEFAREASGAAEWPPRLDRLSLVTMADEETGRARGSSRQETRIRLADLRSKRTL